MSDQQCTSNNTYLLDTESATEMARLINLDRYLTKSMGGPLSEQPDPSRFQQVLDLACGPGGWVLNVAFAYPEMEVAGIDISTTMIAYANARARSQKLLNASFGIMSILEPLDFADESFDLINARFLVVALKRDAWPHVLRECMRILRPGGVLRLTENNTLGVTNSPAFERLMVVTGRIAQLAGYGFSSEEGNLGMMPMLEPLLRDAGCQQIQIREHAMDFSAGTEAHLDKYHDTDILFHAWQSRLISTGMITQQEMEQLSQQLPIEMLANDFRGVLHFLTAWGTKP